MIEPLITQPKVSIRELRKLGLTHISVFDTGASTNIGRPIGAPTSAPSQARKITAKREL